MHAVVTGAAGFIGSHLCGYLLDLHDQVVGVDAITDYYDPELKRRNLAQLQGRNGFTFHQADLTQAPLLELFDGADVIYHLAGQPGVRASWQACFPDYLTRNILSTQAVLETVRAHRIRKLIYASSSSVYGDALTHPTPETARPQPVSPYGVTKLAAEHLCEVYRKAYGVPTISLRLFSVYGPHQRPDMAFSRLIAAAASGQPFSLNGDGEQTRDFTYVTDVVAAMRAAACSDFTGITNIGGGSQTSINNVIEMLQLLAGPVEVVRHPHIKGDVRHTSADTSLARTAFGYIPGIRLAEGLAAMVAAARRFHEVAIRSCNGEPGIPQQQHCGITPHTPHGLLLGNEQLSIDSLVTPPSADCQDPTHDARVRRT
jgi:nucleoside-diphosphate-sugar epimerase